MVHREDRLSKEKDFVEGKRKMEIYIKETQPLVYIPHAKLVVRILSTTHNQLQVRIVGITTLEQDYFRDKNGETTTKRFVCERGHTWEITERDVIAQSLTVEHVREVDGRWWD